MLDEVGYGKVDDGDGCCMEVEEGVAIVPGNDWVE